MNSSRAALFENKPKFDTKSTVMVCENCEIKLSVNKVKLIAVVILPQSKKGKGCTPWKDQSGVKASIFYIQKY